MPQQDIPLPAVLQSMANTEGISADNFSRTLFGVMLSERRLNPDAFDHDYLNNDAYLEVWKRGGVPKSKQLTNQAACAMANVIQHQGYTGNDGNLFAVCVPSGSVRSISVKFWTAIRLDGDKNTQAAADTVANTIGKAIHKHAELLSLNPFTTYIANNVWTGKSGNDSDIYDWYGSSIEMGLFSETSTYAGSFIALCKAGAYNHKTGWLNAFGRKA